MLSEFWARNPVAAESRKKILELVEVAPGHTYKRPDVRDGKPAPYDARQLCFFYGHFLAKHIEALKELVKGLPRCKLNVTKRYARVTLYSDDYQGK